MCLIAGIMLKNISVRESHAIVIRNLGRLFQKKLRQMFSNWMLESKEFKTLTLRQSPSNDMPQNKSFTRGITGNVAHQSPRGNMYKLFDCIKTPLKRFLACLKFYKKEIRLCYLHKSTNSGPTPGLEKKSESLYIKEKRSSLNTQGKHIPLKLFN